MQGEESGTTHETWISSDFDDVLFGLGNDVYNQEPIVSKRYGLILCRQIPCFRVLIISRCWLNHIIYKIERRIQFFYPQLKQKLVTELFAPKIP